MVSQKQPETDDGLSGTRAADVGDAAIAVAIAELMWLAEYQRTCLKRAMTELEKVSSKGLMDAVKLVVDVTDLYGQMYVARDLTKSQSGVEGQTCD